MKNKSSAFRRTSLPLFLHISILHVLAMNMALSQGSEYIIAKGDQLLVTVWGYNEFTTTSTVKETGLFTMPLLGDLKAAGLTKEEFISSLQKRLAEYIQGEIRITVSVLSSLGQRVTILGAVFRPDNYPVSTDVSLLEVLSMAGGYLPDARLSKIKIFHKDKSTPTSVDLDYYIDRSDIESIPKVRSGDIIFVPKQQNVVKEFGEFFRDVAFLFTLFRLTDVAR
jgi:polysaccharide export outer membrane protein